MNKWKLYYDGHIQERYDADHDDVANRHVALCFSLVFLLDAMAGHRCPGLV